MEEKILTVEEFFNELVQLEEEVKLSNNVPALYESISACASNEELVRLVFSIAALKEKERLIRFRISRTVEFCALFDGIVQLGLTIEKWREDSNKKEAYERFCKRNLDVCTGRIEPLIYHFQSSTRYDILEWKYRLSKINEKNPILTEEDFFFGLKFLESELKDSVLIKNLYEAISDISSDFKELKQLVRIIDEEKKTITIRPERVIWSNAIVICTRHDSVVQLGRTIKKWREDSNKKEAYERFCRLYLEATKF